MGQVGQDVDLFQLLEDLVPVLVAGLGQAQNGQLKKIAEKIKMIKCACGKSDYSKINGVWFAASACLLYSNQCCGAGQTLIGSGGKYFFFNYRNFK